MNGYTLHWTDNNKLFVGDRDPHGYTITLQ